VLTGMLNRRKLLPVWLSLRSTESVTAWPDRLVPAARNVTGTPCFAAMGRMRATSASLWICGSDRVRVGNDAAAVRIHADADDDDDSRVGYGTQRNETG